MRRTHARNIYVGTNAERAALTLPSTLQGALFYDTDDTALYYWNGASWTTFSAGSLSFLNLNDVPAAYTGAGGYVVKVKVTEDGLEFTAPSAGDGDVVGPAGASDESIVVFDGVTGKLIKDSGTVLADLALKSNVLELDNTTSFTPTADYHPATKKYVDDNSGGASAFTDLSDVPGSYASQGGKVVSVKADESGLEFVEGGGSASVPAALRKFLYDEFV